MFIVTDSFFSTHTSSSQGKFLRQMTFPSVPPPSSFSQITIPAPELDHHYLDADVNSYV